LTFFIFYDIIRLVLLRRRTKICSHY
jgi:hypothetical protein